jgi:hypothetical protein
MTQDIRLSTNTGNLNNVEAQANTRKLSNTDAKAMDAGKRLHKWTQPALLEGADEAFLQKCREQFEAEHSNSK